MLLRRLSPVLALVAIAAPLSQAAYGQTVALTGSQGGQAFPTSPADTTITPPEQVSPSLEVPPQQSEDGPVMLEAPAPDEGAPNYGKPRKPKPKLFKPIHTTAKSLAPLVRYRDATRRARAVVPLPVLPEGELPVPPPTEAVLARPLPPRRARVEVDPYIPTGVQIGELILRPFVETTTGYESNPNQVAATVRPSSVLRVNGGLDVLSDFSSGSLTANVRGGYSDFPSNTNANRPDLSATVDGRIDVTRIDTIDTEARFTLATQTPGSPLLAVPNSVFITNRPVISSEGTTLGGTHLFGPLAVSLKGTFDRTQYGDATQSDGTLYRYSQDNYNDYGGVARASYEITPAIVPFAEAGVDSRVRDNAVDLSGFYRDSVGGTARGGATFDVLGYVTGTASAGYVERHYADARLPNLRGPTLDGTIVVAVTPLTTVTLRAGTTASETTLAGASGAISRNFGIEVAHTFFRHFTLSGIATVQPNEYQGVQGHETYSTFGLKGAYSVTRDVQLIASASHQTLTSTFLGQGFTDNIFLAGVRLQR